ncbi:hypothetical protein EUGRSUZ_G02784 [Eucalyptus grandis]|uniref:Uncharacterized protein n=2 Tax=Eucalyptus grandis TaxID=71139 RepID=A0ACC3K7N4_EUCGR|nr:hypothetical protein EUGRSUZ_G02784 [Eucalyptus grandis]
MPSTLLKLCYICLDTDTRTSYLIKSHLSWKKIHKEPYVALLGFYSFLQLQTSMEKSFTKKKKKSNEKSVCWHRKVLE